MAKQISTDKSTDKRLKNLKPPWPKGKSGNPAGLKRGIRQWSTVLRERFESGEITQEHLMTVLIAEAHKGNLKAIEMIQERMDGKATQPITGDMAVVVKIVADGKGKTQ